MNTKKLFVLSILVAGALIAAVPALAADHEAKGEEEKKFHIHGEIRSRLEYTENYFDLSDTTDDSFGYYPYRVRIAADGQLADNVRGYVELQGAGHFGNDSPFWNSTFPPDQSFEPFTDQDDINLYQGFVELQKIAGSSFSVRVGRQEHTYGTELLLGDNDFYAGTSFDGGRGWWSTDRYEVNLFYYKIFENNVVQGSGFVGNGTSSDENLFGGTLDWKIGGEDGGSTIGAYLMKYQALDFDTGWWDLGGRFARMPSKDQAFDWNAELVWQSGESNAGGPPKVDIKGYLFEGWFGYSFGGGGRHRVHVGGLIASGDDGTDPTKAEDFLTLFGDNYAYNRLGDSDFYTTTNITDWNAGYDFTTENEKHWFGASIHKFTLTEVSPTALTTSPVNSFFGPSLTVLNEDDLGSEIDAKYGYKFADNTKLTVGVAKLAAGDAFGTSVDDVLRLYGQVKVRW